MTTLLDPRTVATRTLVDGDARRPREDALPEHVEYRDEGCDLFASCLGCPLPRCRYDEPGGARTMLNRVRDEEIRRLHCQHAVSVDELSTRYRISRRTVFRVLQAPPRAHLAVAAVEEHN